MPAFTLLTDRISETIEILRTQLEAPLDPVMTADARGRIHGFKAVLKMIEDMEREAE